jgi:peptidyl-prolyl cis-trans isomerase D
MLTALRNSAQSWLIKLLLGIIVITFVISFGIGTFSNPKEVLVTVDSEEIMVSQFLRQYQQELDRLRQRFPDNAEVLANQLNLREQVMNRMVNRSLILRAAQRHGFQVTEEEVQASVTGQPAFQVNGNFDFDTYRQILSQNNLTPSAYEEQLRDDLLVSKVQRSLTAGVIVGDPQVEQRYRVENEKVEVDYLFVDPARFSLPTPPGEEQVRAYYEKHPEAFTQPERFGLHYFLLGLPQLEKEVEVQPRAVERYYERNVESEFSTPTKVRASHILKRLPADATPEQVANARKAMEGILAKVKAGEDFARLARAQSEDFSKEKGGDLGLFSRDEMVPAFADAAFALPKGGISEVVRTQFGLHIIQVTDIEQGVRKPWRPCTRRSRRRCGPGAPNAGWSWSWNACRSASPRRVWRRWPSLSGCRWRTAGCSTARW